MNIFDELDSLYSEIDNSYATKELQARSQKFINIEKDMQRKRELNDQSYYLFLFTRLEDRIKELSNKLIDKKISSITNFKNKRAWEIIKERKDKDRLNLMERVSFFTPLNSPNYNKIHSYNRQRDKIAHGGIVDTISIPSVFIEMKRFYYDLAR